MIQEMYTALYNMQDKDFSYGSKILTITGYDVDEAKGKVYIHTNEANRHFERPIDSVMALLREFKPISGERQQTTVSNIPATADKLVSSTNNLVANLQQTLLDNIERVKNDKEYIPQATAINKNVNSIISLTRLQLDALRMQENLNNR